MQKLDGWWCLNSEDTDTGGDDCEEEELDMMTRVNGECEDWNWFTADLRA